MDQPRVHYLHTTAIVENLKNTWSWDWQYTCSLDHLPYEVVAQLVNFHCIIAWIDLPHSVSAFQCFSVPAAKKLQTYTDTLSPWSVVISTVVPVHIERCNQWLLHRQLGPVVRSLHAASGVDSQGLSKSLLEAYLQYNASKVQHGCVPATGQLLLDPILCMYLSNTSLQNSILVIRSESWSICCPVCWSQSCCCNFWH